MLIPLALRGVKFVPSGAAQLLRRNLLIYGLGGIDRPVHRDQAHRHVRHRPGGEVMRRQLLPAIMMMVVFTVLLGIVYPLVVTGIAQVGFRTRRTARSSSEREGRRLEAPRPDVHEGEVLPRRPERRQSPPVGRGRRARTRQPCRERPEGPTRTSAARTSGRRTRTSCRGEAARRGLPQGERVSPKDEGARSTRSPRRLRGSTRTSRWPTPASRRTGSPTSAGSRSPRSTKLIDDNTDGRSLGFLGEPGVNVLARTWRSTARSATVTVTP